MSAVVHELVRNPRKALESYVLLFVAIIVFLAIPFVGAEYLNSHPEYVFGFFVVSYVVVKAVVYREEIAAWL